MATPVGHVLIAVLAGRMAVAEGKSPWRWFTLAGLTTLAPDLDFIPGFLISDINRFHQGPSHSIGAAIISGGLAALLAGVVGGRRLHLGLAACALYASHLLLDFLTADGSPPFGQPLLWPLTREYFANDSPIFAGVRHAGADGTLAGFLGDVLSSHNFRAAGRELMLVGPVVCVLWLVLRYGTQGRARASSAIRRTSPPNTTGALDRTD